MFFFISLLTVLRAFLYSFQSFASFVSIALILSRSLLRIKLAMSLVNQGDLLLRILARFKGACLSTTAVNKAFHFSH